ncbi:MAG: hypothetical protein RR942_00505 [Romboutsia sp.]
MDNMNELKKDLKKTAKKAEYMAKEVANDVRDNIEGAVHIMEEKKDQMMDKFEQKKFSAEIKHQMEKEYK